MSVHDYAEGFHQHEFDEDGYSVLIVCSRGQEPVTVTVGPVAKGVVALRTPLHRLAAAPPQSCRWPLSAYIQEAVDEAEARIALRAERDGC